MLYVETISIIMYTLAPAFRIECAGAGLIVNTIIVNLGSSLYRGLHISS